MQTPRLYAWNCMSAFFQTQHTEEKTEDTWGLTLSDTMQIKTGYTEDTAGSQLAKFNCI